MIETYKKMNQTLQKIKKNNKCTNVTCNANCEKSKCCV